MSTVEESKRDVVADSGSDDDEDNILTSFPSPSNEKSPSTLSIAVSQSASISEGDSKGCIATSS